MLLALMELKLIPKLLLVRGWPEPENGSAVRSFLDLTDYFRSYVGLYRVVLGWSGL